MMAKYIKTEEGYKLPSDIENISANTNYADQIEMLIEADMLPAVHDASGAILTDENGNIILRY